MKRKFFALFDCEDAEKWANHPYFTWFPAMKEVNEDWKWFRIYLGEYPTEEELGRLDGIIITGSHHSVNQNDPWVLELLNFIREFERRTRENSYPNNNIPKMIGSCFGCQAIGKALGGVVSSNLSRNFVFKIEEVQLLDRLREFDFGVDLYQRGYKNHGGKSVIRVLESHSESVIQVPEGAIPLAISKTSPNEIFYINNNILAIQSHPELLPDIAMDKIFPSLQTAGKIINELETVESLNLPNDHSPVIQSFLRLFLKS